MSELEQHIGHSFKKTRHGSHQVVILEKIRRDRVTLREPGHKEAFSLPIRQFEKFFKRCGDR